MWRRAGRAGVVATNTPDVLTNACADFTWALILAITRRLGEGERAVRAGTWAGWALDYMLGMELRGKQLGIVGMGRIGRAVAERAPAFGMQVAYTARRPANLAGAQHMPLDRLLATSDVVSLHCPMSDETRHLINDTALLRMKRTAYLINTARGPVVDEAALARALRDGRLAGAALDVYEREPIVHPDLLGARERPADPAPGQRHHRDPYRDGRPRRLERAGGARGSAAADACLTRSGRHEGHEAGHEGHEAETRSTRRSQPLGTEGPKPVRPSPNQNLEPEPEPPEPRTPNLEPNPMPRPKPALVEKVMRTLAREIDGMELPAIEKISESQQEDPFQILIATLLSARTQDATTHAASTRLFRRARTPRTMAKLPVEEIEQLIYPVSFYRNKAAHVKATAGIVATSYRGQVPDTLEQLVTLPGVGRKTATLVMILAFQSQRHICVDTHVHRIANRLGWVRTRTPAADRAGAVPAASTPLVALHQPVPGDVGAERVPAGVSSMRRVRHRGRLPPARRAPGTGAPSRGRSHARGPSERSVMSMISSRAVGRVDLHRRQRRSGGRIATGACACRAARQPPRPAPVR